MGLGRLKIHGVGNQDLGLTQTIFMSLPLPSLPEQKAKELCYAIENIDLMKKSILARLFRGELIINNPNEESALELLEEVLRERVEV